MRALISVYDKEGIVEFATELEKLGYEIVSTGGTYKKLKDSGLKVIEIDEVTKFPEILNGRVKTLNPLIHGAILYKRDNEEHLKIVNEHNITSIDIVVNSLYPFEECLKRGASHDEMIENIDIGGPSMIRSAAKNYKDVLIVTNRNQYDEVLKRLKENSCDEEFRFSLAKEAFNLTARYDSLIAGYFNSFGEKEEFEKILEPKYVLKEVLRYGENPHQKAAFYEEENIDKVEYKVLHGKQISYNNLNDMYGAIKALKNFGDIPTAIAVKHTNPCGMGTGATLAEAFKKAYECDDESIFGGIIALNREVDLETAEMLSKIFLEIVVAPSFAKDAYELLAKKKNIRLIEMPRINDFKIKMSVKEVLNGIIVQEYDNVDLDEDKLEVVTKRKPTEEEMKELRFAWTAVKASASNSVVVAKNGGTLGIGQGQTKRSWAVEEALERAGDKIEGAVFASDGFFFGDTMELLNKYGIKAIIQPGGSVKDAEVIEFADAHDMSVVFTHIRHFRH